MLEGSFILIRELFPGDDLQRAKRISQYQKALFNKASNSSKTSYYSSSRSLRVLVDLKCFNNEDASKNNNEKTDHKINFNIFNKSKSKSVNTIDRAPKNSNPNADEDEKSRSREIDSF